MGSIFGAGATGQVGVYAQIRSLMTGLIGNGTIMAAYNQGNWALYTNVTPEQPGSGEYELAVPGYLPAGLYKATFYVPLGGSPASGDTPFATEVFSWDGGAVIYQGSGVDVAKINGSAPAAVKLAVSANAFVTGVAAAGTLTTAQMTTDLTDTVPNIFNGRTMIFTAGVNKNLAVLLTGYAVTGGKLTFVAFNNLPAPAAPGLGDTFVII